MVDCDSGKITKNINRQ